MLLDLYPIWKKVLSFGSERVMWPARRALKTKGSSELRLRASITQQGHAAMETTFPMNLTVESQGRSVFEPERLSPELRGQLDHARRRGEELIELLILSDEI